MKDDSVSEVLTGLTETGFLEPHQAAHDHL